MLSRCLRYGRGLRIGAVDINDWPSGGNNPLDLSSNAGMALLVIVVFINTLAFDSLYCRIIFYIYIIKVIYIR